MKPDLLDIIASGWAKDCIALVSLGCFLTGAVMVLSAFA